MNVSIQTLSHVSFFVIFTRLMMAPFNVQSNESLSNDVGIVVSYIQIL